MHTNSVKARRVDNILREWDTVGQMPERGDYQLSIDADGKYRGMWICCPGCRTISLLPDGITQAGAVQKWTFDGNADAPTLKPSINHVGCWHGFLTAGQFVSC